MCARWAQNHWESPELPIVQQTLIANWLPWIYYFVSTIQLDTTSPLAKLSRSLEKNTNYKDVPLEIIGYVTQVFRCDKNGIPTSFDKTLFERESSDLSKAIETHKEAVKKFARGCAIYNRSGIRIE